MRIAMFSDNFHPELSGIADSLATVSVELGRRGHEVRFYVPRYAAADYRRLGLPCAEIDLGDRVSVSRLPALRYPTGTGQGRLVLPTGLRWRGIRDFGPDILHVHLPFPVGLEGLVAARRLRRPLVGTNHTPVTEFLHYGPARGAWTRRLTADYTAWFYNRCAFVSSPCRAILEEMRACGLRVLHRVVPNPIRLETFRPLPDRRTLKQRFGFSDFTVLYAGRLAPEKHLDLVLRALPVVAAEVPAVRLALLGTGVSEGGLRALCRSTALGERVRFLGYVPSLATVAEIYNAADVFVSPSTAETQSIAAMQAMACGLPVVGVRSWGLAEYVTERTGLLVEPGDRVALATALVYLAQNPEVRLSLGSSGEDLAARFSPSAIAAEWEAIYEQLLSARAERASASPIPSAVRRSGRGGAETRRDSAA